MTRPAEVFGVKEAPTLPALPGGLARFLQPAPPRVPGERCEMCAEPVREGHSHVVNLESRNILCVCRPCALLFTSEGAAQGRYRAIPDRHLYDPSFAITAAQWDSIQIPVGMAFLFVNSVLDKFVAFYPSPAGATESLLALDRWQEVLEANPHMADLRPDVEALLLRRVDDHFECYLVPIDACYELVGRVRRQWKGFDGGEEAWREIDGFFTALKDRCGIVRGTAT